MAESLFIKVISGEVKIVIDQRFKLSEIAKAHDALEGRETTGATILEV